MSPASAIYVGTVRHRRYAPVPHAFAYRVFMMYLDLDELPALFDGVPLWSARRPAAAWYRRADYLGDPRRPLADCVREVCAEARGDPPAGPIRLLTNLRYFGLRMNPVTFYYCFDGGGALDCVVAEVNNTPWNQRHCYVIDGGGSIDGGDRRALRDEFAKRFHVSPFHPLDMRYRWRGNSPGERLAVHMENHRDGQRVTDATLKLERRALSRGALLATLAEFPWMTAKVGAGIYWQAARLAWKGAPFHPHPGAAPAHSSQRSGESS